MALTSASLVLERSWGVDLVIRCKDEEVGRMRDDDRYGVWPGRDLPLKNEVVIGDFSGALAHCSFRAFFTMHRRAVIIRSISANERS